MIRAILVDDRKSHLLTLKKYLEEYNEIIEIIGEFTDVTKACARIIREKPDVLFLDIEMPVLSGIELAQKVKGICSNVIFLTEYMQYAPDTISIEPIHFIDKDRIEKFLPEAIARLKVRMDLPEIILKDKTENGVFELERSPWQINKIAIIDYCKISLASLKSGKAITHNIEISHESFVTLSKFIFIKKYGLTIPSFNRETLNPKQDKKSFPNLNQNIIHFIKDLNLRLNSKNLQLKVGDIFEKQSRGYYSLVIKHEDIFLPDNAKVLSNWINNQLMPFIKELNLHVELSIEKMDKKGLIKLIKK